MKRCPSRGKARAGLHMCGTRFGDDSRGSHDFLVVEVPDLDDDFEWVARGLDESTDLLNIFQDSGIVLGLEGPNVHHHIKIVGTTL